MLIEVQAKDLVLIEGLGVRYKKIGSPVSKFEDDEATERVEFYDYYLNELMNHHEIPTKYKEDLISKIIDNVSYYMGENREEYLNLSYLNDLTKIIMVEECADLKDKLFNPLLENEVV